MHIIYVDDIYLCHNSAGVNENIADLVQAAVNEDGHRKILGAAERFEEENLAR